MGLSEKMKFTAGILAVAHAKAVVPVIIGGSTATKHSEPYILSIRGQTGSHYCGGSLINLSKGITAAHCNKGFSGVTAVAGVHNINKEEEDSQTVNVVRIRKHPNYNSSVKGGSDIAVLLFDKPFVQNEYVVPIPLPMHQI